MFDTDKFRGNSDKEDFPFDYFEIQNKINRSKNEYSVIKCSLISNLLQKSDITNQEGVKLFAFIESQNDVILELEKVIEHITRNETQKANPLTKEKTLESNYISKINVLQKESKDLKAELIKKERIIEILIEKLQNKSFPPEEINNQVILGDACFLAKSNPDANANKSKKEALPVLNVSDVVRAGNENISVRYSTCKNNSNYSEDYQNSLCSLRSSASQFFINNNYNCKLENKFFVNNEEMNEVNMDNQGSIQFKSKINREKVNNKNLHNYISIPLKSNGDLLDVSQFSSVKNSLKDGNDYYLDKNNNEAFLNFNLVKDLRDLNNSKSTTHKFSNERIINNYPSNPNREKINYNFNQGQIDYTDSNNSFIDKQINFNVTLENEISQLNNNSYYQLIENQPLIEEDNVNDLSSLKVMNPENPTLSRNNSFISNKTNKNKSSKLVLNTQNKEKSEIIRNQYTLKKFIPISNDVKGIKKNVRSNESNSVTEFSRNLKLDRFDINSKVKDSSRINSSKNSQSGINIDNSNSKITQSNTGNKRQNSLLKGKDIKEISYRKNYNAKMKQIETNFESLIINDISITNPSIINSNSNTPYRSENVPNTSTIDANAMYPFKSNVTDFHQKDSLYQCQYDNNNSNYRQINYHNSKSRDEEIIAIGQHNNNDKANEENANENDNNQSSRRASIFNFRNSALLKNLNSSNLKIVNGNDLNKIKEESDEESTIMSQNISFLD